MQIRKLYRLLGEEIKKGNGRADVCINKKTFIHPLENDGCCIIPVESLNVEDVLILNDDGGSSDENGNEKHSIKLVIKGE